MSEARFAPSEGDWDPPADWQAIRTVDAHAAGEPLRVILRGVPRLEGPTMLDRRRQAEDRLDGLRRTLMWEPRGHADMYGCLLTEPESATSDFGVLFLHNAGWSTMCGHGIIAVATVALEVGIVPARGPETVVHIDSPAGPIRAVAEVDRGRVARVRFRNVPSFVLTRDRHVDVAGLGRVRYDVAYGGAFYAFVDAAQLGLTCRPDEVERLIDAGRAIKRAVSEAMPIRHPDSDDLSFLYGTIFVAPPLQGADSRNVCIFANGEVDRSPTGTGVSARMALHRARGELSVGESMRIESLLGTSFVGRAVEDTVVGPYEAVIPEVEGTAYITGTHTFVVDPDDPLRAGFILR